MVIVFIKQYHLSFQMAKALYELNSAKAASDHDNSRFSQVCNAGSGGDQRGIQSEIF